MSTGDVDEEGSRVADGPRVTATAAFPGAVYRVEDGDRTVAVPSGIPGDGGPGSRNASVGLAPSRRDPRAGRSTAGTALDGLPADAWATVLAGDPDALVVMRRPRDPDAVEVPDDLPDEVYVPGGEVTLPPELADATPLDDGDVVETPNATLRARAVESASTGTVGLDVTAGGRRALLAGVLTAGVRDIVPDAGGADRLVEHVDGVPSVDAVLVGGGTDRDGFRGVVRATEPRVAHVTGPGERRRGDWESERLLRVARTCPETRTADPWTAPLTVDLGGEELVVDGRETWRAGGGSTGREV